METYVMKKISYLFVLLAMVMLTSCNFENEPIIRYEVNADNPEESYVAEIITGKINSSPKEFFFDYDPNVKIDRLVAVGSRNAILTSMTWPSGMLDYSNVYYDIPLSDEVVSWVIEFPKKRNRPSKNELQKMCVDYINNAGFSIDTLHKPSYRLVITDVDKFKKASVASKTKQNVYYGNVYSQSIRVKDNHIAIIKHNKEGVIQNADMLELGLRDFHHIPTLNEVDSILTNERIYLKPEFYSEPKSVEEVNEMLSEYGLSLVPTGEEMMVVTFSVKDEAVK